MQDLSKEHVNLGIERLISHLKEEYKDPGCRVEEVRNILVLLHESEDETPLLLQYSQSNHELFHWLTVNMESNSQIAELLYPWLYNLIQNNSLHSVYFVNQFIPTLMWQYLNSQQQSEEVKGVEACLVAMTNRESREGDRSLSFRYPSIHHASLYHQPSHIGHNGGLTEDALKNHLNVDERVFEEKGREEINNITVSNRLRMMTYLSKRYIQHISQVSSCSLQRMCWFTLWFAGSGMPFAEKGNESSPQWPLAKARVHVNSELLIALLSVVQHAMYYGHSLVGEKALDVMLLRSQYEMLSDVYMMASSIKDHIAVSQVSPSFRPFGIQLPQLQGTVNDKKRRPIRSSFIRQDGRQDARRRISSDALENEAEPGSASVIIDLTEGDEVKSEESDIFTAGAFKGGRLQSEESS